MVQAVDASKNRPSDPRNQEVVFPAGAPQNGNLLTPINNSRFIKWYLSILPAYRKGITPLRRGIETGIAHGFWLINPFAKLGPLRDTDIADRAGLLAGIGLVVISSGAIFLYANSNPKPPFVAVGTPQPPADLNTGAGWNKYATGFLAGGLGGAVLGYLVLSNVEVIQNLFK